MHRKLGQHFLKDKSIVKRIIATLSPVRGETIVEIGPGHGELTVPLIEAAGKNGCKIIAIEKDPKLAEELEYRIQNTRTEAVKVVRGNALKILPQLLVSHALNSVPYALVGNIPYYITGHLLRSIGALEHKPRRVVLMVQKEVAERIAAKPPRMNRLAASVQFWSEPNIITIVPKTAFDPPPEVESAVISLETRKNISRAQEASCYKVIRALFAQPRKTVVNNLLVLAHGEKEKIISLLRNLGVAPDLRPQNLSLSMIQKIADALE